MDDLSVNKGVRNLDTPQYYRPRRGYGKADAYVPREYLASDVAKSFVQNKLNPEDNNLSLNEVNISKVYLKDHRKLFFSNKLEDNHEI